MIETTGNTVMITITAGVGSGPFGVAVTPDGKHAYVVNQSSNNVSVIDTASNTVVGTPITVGTTPIGVAVTPDGKHAYVTNFGANSVSVIETTGNTVMMHDLGHGAHFPLKMHASERDPVQLDRITQYHDHGGRAFYFPFGIRPLPPHWRQWSALS